MSKKVYLSELGPYYYLLLHLMDERNICTSEGLKKVCKGGNSILNDKTIPKNLFKLLYRRINILSTAGIIDGERGSYRIKSGHREDVRTVLNEKREVYTCFLK